MEKKITRKERNNIYKNMLQLYNDEASGYYMLCESPFSGLGFKTDGLCCAAGKVMYNSSFEDVDMKILPELYNMLPVIKSDTTYLWPTRDESGHTIRVLALLEAIKQTK